MTTYSIIRFYSDERDSEVIETGLTLEEAQAHCNNPDTRGVTAFGVEWFDGYDKDEEFDVGSGSSVLDSEHRLFPDVLNDRLGDMRSRWQIH